jgi:hypothetical protein
MNGRAKNGSAESDPVVKELRAIRTVVEDLLILESARAGLTNAGVRAVTKVDNNRVSRIASRVRSARNGEEGD